MGEPMRIAISKLNGGNYQVWKFKMELLLIKEELWDQVKTTVPTEAAAASAWKKKDDKARATICLLVEDSQLMHIRKATTAKEAWDSLKEYHEKSTLTSKVYLLRQICNLKLSETGNMEQHIATMQELVDKLTALGEEIKDHFFVAILLSSLPETYGTLITALESRPEAELTLDFVKGKLLDEYRRRKGVPDLDNDNTAMKASQNNSATSEKGQKMCFFCHKIGHFKQDCIKFKRWKLKKEKANQAESSENSSDFLCFSAYQEERKEELWYIDSGATSHMTNNRAAFKSLVLKKLPDVTLANGRGTKAFGIGTVITKCLDGNNKETNVELRDVLYVPDLTNNLLSVKKLTEKGLTVQFKDSGCKIIKGDLIVARASLISGMYVFRATSKAFVASGSSHSINCQHTWHRRFGHRNIHDIQQLQEKFMVSGIKIQDCGIREICGCCAKGKLSRNPFPKGHANRAKRILDLVHTDLCGPMQATTPSGKRYFMTMIDDYSRFTEIFFLKDKSEVADKIEEYTQYVKNKFGRAPTVIRSDNGREYNNYKVKQLFVKEGIRPQYTAPYTPEQNGVAERKNRTLMEAARCMLIDASMDNRYWAEAVNTANFLQNILPSTAIEKTPYELWYGRKASVDNLRIFGCEGYTLIPKEKRRKLEDKSLLLTFVGYSTESKGYRMLDKETNRITISRDVKFDENYEMNIVKEKEKQLQEEKEKLEKDDEGRTRYVEISLNENSFEGEYAEEGDSRAIGGTVRQSERSTKGQPPIRYSPTASLVTEENGEPRTPHEALNGPERKEWAQAMDEEFRSLEKNRTWKLTDLPEGRKAIGCKWVFKKKQNTEIQKPKYKARLVAQGFSQKYGIDYDEVFAPVVRAETLRLLLTIAGKRRLKIYHYDAKTAFLNGELKETIFMKQPEGYAIAGKEHLVCNLMKSLYGLKQAAKVWNEKLHRTIISLGFKQSTSDPCLYSKQTKNEVQYMIVYVDDILIASSNTQEICETASGLERKFELTQLGELEHYLGINVQKDSEGIYSINQEQYIDKIIERFGQVHAKPSKIPLDTGYFKMSENKTPMTNSDDYQKLIGALLYVTTHTRPDIAASVSILSQKVKQPSMNDWTEAKRVLRYLKGTKNLRLKLGGKNSGLIVYADADFAEDKTDRKSHSGHLFQYNGGAIAWSCRKQTCTAWSSCEAEYISLAEASRELLWIRRLLEDFHEKQPGATRVYEDNQSTIKLIKSKEFRNRTKHIDIKYHFVSDLVEKKVIDLQYCPTEDMIGDMFTKPLQQIKLKKHREGCQLINQK